MQHGPRAQRLPVKLKTFFRCSSGRFLSHTWRMVADYVSVMLLVLHGALSAAEWDGLVCAQSGPPETRWERWKRKQHNQWVRKTNAENYSQRCDFQNKMRVRAADIGSCHSLSATLGIASISTRRRSCSMSVMMTASTVWAYAALR